MLICMHTVISFPCTCRFRIRTVRRRTGLSRLTRMVDGGSFAQLRFNRHIIGVAFHVRQSHARTEAEAPTASGAVE